MTLNWTLKTETIPHDFFAKVCIQETDTYRLTDGDGVEALGPYMGVLFLYSFVEHHART